MAVSILTKAGNIISNLIIILLLAILCFIVVSNLFFGIEVKAVLTGSMEPELPVGSLVFIKPTAYENINIGDDITFVRDESLTLITHRVISKDDLTKQITTKGLTNNISDPPTSYENIVGKVIFDIPYIGYIIIFASDLKGKIILCIFATTLILFSFLFNKDDQKNKNIEGKNKFA